MLGSVLVRPLLDQSQLVDKSLPFVRIQSLVLQQALQVVNLRLSR